MYYLIFYFAETSCTKIMENCASCELLQKTTGKQIYCNHKSCGCQEKCVHSYTSRESKVKIIDSYIILYC